MTTLHDIDKFCDYFEAQVIELDNLSSEQVSAESITQVRLYKKTLIISAIDTLANLRFSQDSYKEFHQHSSARFVRFVAEFCEWQSGNLISVPYLFEQLRVNKLNDKKLYDVLQKKLVSHNASAGSFLDIEMLDMEVGSLIEYTHSEIEERLIYESQHHALLYGFDNCIAHEDKDKCGVMEICQYAQPHYYSYLQDKNSDNLTRWYISYPVEHFKRLFFSGMKNIKRHFINTNINPYTLIGDRRDHSRWW